MVDSGASTLFIHQIVAAAAAEFPGTAVILVVDAAARALHQGLTGLGQLRAMCPMWLQL